MAKLSHKELRSQRPTWKPPRLSNIAACSGETLVAFTTLCNRLRRWSFVMVSSLLVQPIANGRRSFSAHPPVPSIKCFLVASSTAILTEEVFDPSSGDRSQNPVAEGNDVRSRLTEAKLCTKFGETEHWICLVGSVYSSQASIGGHLNVDDRSCPVRPRLVEDRLIEGVIISKVVIATTGKLCVSHLRSAIGLRTNLRLASCSRIL